jgi:DNA-binding transcriptional regulator YiaG
MKSDLFVYRGRRSQEHSKKRGSTLNCESCGMELNQRKATDDAPYAYTLSGLKNALLVGMFVRQCLHCDVESPVIPKIAQLHQVIAQNLVSKAALLDGDEIRFLRKNAGFPANKFAALLGITPEHLSRVENGKINYLGPGGDKLVRAIVTAQRDGGDCARKVLLEMAERLEGARQSAPGPIFRLERNRWRSAA